MSDSYSGTPNGDFASINGTADGVAASSHAPVSSVTRIKLMGYAGFAGFANLPNQEHRKSVRKGFQFMAMVAGTRRPLSRFRVWASEFQSARIGT